MCWAVFGSQRTLLSRKMSHRGGHSHMPQGPSATQILGRKKTFKKSIKFVYARKIENLHGHSTGRTQSPQSHGKERTVPNRVFSFTFKFLYRLSVNSTEGAVRPQTFLHTKLIPWNTQIFQLFQTLLIAGYLCQDLGLSRPFFIFFFPKIFQNQQFQTLKTGET